MSEMFFCFVMTIWVKWIIEKEKHIRWDLGSIHWFLVEWMQIRCELSLFVRKADLSGQKDDISHQAKVCNFRISSYVILLKSDKVYKNKINTCMHELFTMRLASWKSIKLIEKIVLCSWSWCHMLSVPCFQQRYVILVCWTINSSPVGFCDPLVMFSMFCVCFSFSYRSQISTRRAWFYSFYIWGKKSR